MFPESNDITREAAPDGTKPDGVDAQSVAPSGTESARSEADALASGSINAIAPRNGSGPAPDGARDEQSSAPAGASGSTDVSPEPESSSDAPSSEQPDALAGAQSDAPTGTSAETPTGAPKKRRRRRRGKKSHANGAAIATTDAAGTQEPTEEGAETPGVAGTETGASETGATEANAARATTDEKRKAKGSKRPPRDKPGLAKSKKARKPRPEGSHARERTAFHVGEEVFGRVTSVTEHAIMVDLSGKALAIFDRHELAEDDLVPEVGDRFVAHVHGDGSRGGFVVLTRKPLREEDAKPRIEEASKSGQPVLGLVTGTVKGGLEIDIDGVRAFAPGSHVDLRPGADLAHFIGRRLEFTVAQYAKRGRDVVVSRKSYIEAEAKELRKSSLAKLEVGSVVKGIVKSVVQYGAFIAIPSADDIEGLVHMTEASHDRNAKLSDIFHPGAEVDVKILRVDDKGKLWLSHRAATLDPWQEAMKTYAQGTRHKGKVLRLLPFGAFIELAPGVEGLLHTADLTFKRIEHPKDVLKENEEIDVVVADVDKGSHKISLHVAPPAGEENEPRQRIVPHKGLKIAVVAAESAGLVVRVIGMTGRHARGFIPAGHTGTERGTDLRKHFPPGTRLEAKVLEIDPRRGEAKLSLRALKEDTEKAAYQEYRASVAKASKFGTLGDLLAKKR
jgi:small subunit ribosomal protein S1